MILAEWAPLLAVLGASRPLAAWLARLRLWRLATLPAVALPLWLGNYFIWHVPAVYDAALRHQAWLIHLEHGCYFATGLLFWWPLLQGVPRRLASGARAAYAFASFVLAAPLGLLLALVPKPAYDLYVHAPRLWGLSPLVDQQIAGVTMAGEQAIVLFVVFLYWFRRFLAEEGAIEAAGHQSEVVLARVHVPQLNRVLILLENVVDTDILRGEPPVGGRDVVGVGGRRAEATVTKLWLV